MADPKEELEKDESTATEAAEAAARRKARRAARAKAREEAAAEAAEADDTTEADDSDEAGDEDESSDDEQEEAAEGEKAEGAVEAKPNRRERRRRQKLGDDADVPRDRNARIRAQHARKKSSAEGEEALTPLSTGEMIDDALARGTARAGKWAKQNANLLQGLLGAALLAGIGYGVYHWQTSAKSELASSDLNQAVQADRARIDPAAKPDDDDTIQVYKSAAERNSAALASYRKARSDREGSGTALLARLGEAGVLLDQHSYDDALAAYREVKASPLAAADPDVRGRAIEGIGFALEGKGDLNGAAGAFKELDTITGLKTFKELGMYHQARIQAAQGNKEQALKLIKEARERLQTTGESRNASYLVGVLDELQRKLDPTSSPKRGIGGAGKQLSVEELQKLQQQMIREMQKAQEKGEHQDEH